MGWFKKKRNYLIECMARLSSQIDSMHNTVEFFSGIAELFAQYIVFDLKNSIHGIPREKQMIINIAQRYLQEHINDLKFKQIRW